MDKVSYRNSCHPAITLIDAAYSQFAFDRHYHGDIHIGLVTQGGQRFYHRGTRYQVGQGGIVLMPPDELHDGEGQGEGGYQVSVLAIAPSWLQQIFAIDAPQQLLGFTQLIIDDEALFCSLLEFHHLLAQDGLSQLAKDCLPYDYLEPLLSRYGHFTAAAATPLGKQTLIMLKEWLVTQLDQPISLEQLAQRCQLSPTQFQRQFKAQMGIPPYAWLRRLRLEEGMKLLQRGMSGTDVAHQVGFYDQAHFSKAFKATFALSPSAVGRSLY